MKARAVATWVNRYVRAWKTNDPDDIKQLFSENARYFTAPFRRPWKGRKQIVEGWLGRKDQQGQWKFRYNVLAVTARKSFVRGWTTYVNQRAAYSNLWIIRLDAHGRCSEFVEWWMIHS
ncbi:MAG: nuclear transport factor 2 family protein [bacterium]